MVLKYILFATLSMALNIFVWLTCWFWAFIVAAFRLETLPGPLALLHTHDANVYGGVMPLTFVKRFTAACWWLCRNPGYGFDTYVLGLPTDGLVRVKHEHVINGRDDLVRTEWTRKGKRYFGYRRHLPYGSNGRYVKLWFGWHFQTLGKPNKNGYMVHMLKFDVNPFKRFET